MEILYWLFIKPLGFRQEERKINCCTKHHYETPTQKYITKFVQGSGWTAFFIFTGFRFYLVIVATLNPPIPEEVRNQMEDVGSALPLGGEAPQVLKS